MEYAMKYYCELTPNYEDAAEAFKCGGKVKKRASKKEEGGAFKEACGGKVKKKKCKKCGCGMKLSKKGGRVVETCACGCKK